MPVRPFGPVPQVPVEMPNHSAVIVTCLVGRRSEGMQQERHGHRDQQRRGAADQRLDVQRQPRLRG